jgi:chitodextrinase
MTKNDVQTTAGLRLRGGGRSLRLLVVTAAGVVLLLAAGPWWGPAARQPLAAGDPVIAAAGDIACDPANSNFNAGNGTSNACRQKWTSDLLVGGAVDGAVLLGDNQYECGGLAAWQQSYDLSWGRVKSITYPAPGNHEYLTGGGTGCTSANRGAAGYFDYWGTRAGTVAPGKGYYSFDIGTWHLISLNSNCGDAGGCSDSTPQGQWLKADLAAHKNYCTLAYWHIPLYSSGGRAASNSQPFWTQLYNADADLILGSHDHIYERFAPQNASGQVDLARGIREFIVGTGGNNHTSIATVAANSEVRDTTTFGVLKVTLHPTSYDWQFVPAPGSGAFTDSGTTACHGAVADTTPPTVPANLTATATSPGTIRLAWSASTDDSGTVAGYKVTRDGVQVASVTSGTTYIDTVAPATSHSYTVAAFDAAGNTSAASAAASATTPADTTPPTTPTGLAATASASQVDLTWAASTDDVGVSGYLVYRGGVQIATATGTTYSDTTVQPSTSYTYTVAARDAAGNTSPQSSPVAVTTPAPPTTLTFTPADDAYVQQDLAASNFGAVTFVSVDNSPVTHSLLKFNVTGVNGRRVLSAKLRVFCVDPSGFGGEFHRVADSSWSEAAVTWNTAPAQDAAILGTIGAVAAGTWYEVDVTGALTADGLVSFRVSSTSTNGADYASKERGASTAPQLVLTTTTAATDTTPPTAPSNLLATAPAPNRVQLVWTGSVDDSGFVAGYKIYRDSVQIGTSTSASYDDTTAQPATAYSYAVAAYDAAGNTSLLSNTARVTTPADTTAPTAPTGLTATAVGAGEVDLAWVAATDNVRVTGYLVFRNGTQVGTASGTTYADMTTVAATTYTYTVKAVDGAGNQSAASAGATVTTPAAPSTLTFAPTADTFVAQDFVTTNYGALTSLQVDNSPVKHIYVKFTVSGVGSRAVTGAKLRLFCVDPSTAGGDFYRVADSTWTEGTITWNTAPVGDAVAIVSLGAVTTGTWYEVDLSSLITGDGTYSLEVTSPSTNGADYSSKEGSNGPQLVLTLG